MAADRVLDVCELNRHSLWGRASPDPNTALKLMSCHEPMVVLTCGARWSQTLFSSEQTVMNHLKMILLTSDSSLDQSDH